MRIRCLFYTYNNDINTRIDLSKYDGKMAYRIFNKYSRIDGFSIFEVNNEDIIQ